MMMTEDALQQIEIEQMLLSQCVIRKDDGVDVVRLTGVDVSYWKDMAIAVAVTMDLSGRRVLSTDSYSILQLVEYRSGYLQIREGPVLLTLLNKVREPGIVLIDGNGILHPRRCGLASYVGVRLDLITIGVAKRLMCGTLCNRQQNIAYVIDKGETVGAAVWLNERSRPLYVSIGHRISLDTAINIVVQCSHRGQPEPIRLAHQISRGIVREKIHSEEHCDK